MPTIVFQHSDISRPGRLGRTLRDHGHRLDIRRLDAGDPIPPDFDGVDGVIALGGPQSLADPDARPEWMDREIEFLRGAHERQLPVIGVCLGHQLVGAALGAEVVRMEQPEVGFHTISLTPPGQTDNVLAGLAWDSYQFCHHSDEVAQAPPGATVLATSEQCKVQAFRAGMRTYAFQFHFEAAREMVTDLTQSDADALHKAGATVEEIERQVEERYASFARLADRLCINLATLVAVVGRKHVL